MTHRAMVRTGLVLAGLLALAPVLAQAAPPPGIPDGWSDGYVYANGIRIHYYHAIPEPGKPVIVMCHGVTDNGLCWTTLTWKLQDSYDIYMLDTRGHGLSDPFTPSDNGDTLIKDVVDSVHALKLEKPILLGHSMGAATVMRVGAEYPELPKAVIMLDPLLRMGGRRGPRGGARGARQGAAASTNPGRGGRRGPFAGAGMPAAGTRPARGPQRFSLAMFGSPEALVAQNNHSYDELVAICHKDNPKWDMVDCDYWALSKRQYHGAYGDGGRKAMSGAMQIGDSLAKITVPSLILKADAPANVRKADDEAAKVMQHGKLVHIDGAAHNLHHDQLARTVEVLKAFLSTLK